MTKEEFKAEILKANPQAVFIERRNGDLECTETEMLVRLRQEIMVVYGFSSEGFAKTETAGFVQIFAPATKKKRLMTPAECAGKWLVEADGTRHLVVRFNPNCGTIQCMSIHGHAHGVHKDSWQIADTPVSEPYSLEIEE